MEYELVNRRHQHPLLFNNGRFIIGDAVECSRCHQPLYPPAFSCASSVCNFNIHQSCLHLTPQIRSHLHPQHSLELQINKHNCDACGQITSVADAYECGPCNFKLDINCAIADTKASGLFQTGGEKYQHFSHPHPLTLANVHSRKVCFLCQLLVESGSSTYSCSQCDNIHFHQQCAELPRELLNPDRHPHPLFLLFIKNDNNGVLCNSCRNSCRGFAYACSTCKFFLHIQCLQTFNHKHSFTNMLQNKIAFQCRICGKKCEDRFPLYCDICHVLVHKECAEWPSKLKLTEHNHHHPLRFYHFLPDTDKITLCNICGTQIDTEYAVYGCSECNYFTHLNCGQGHQLNNSTQNDKAGAGAGADVDADVDVDVENKLIHRHKLTLFPFPENEKILKDRVCDGCMKCLSDSGPSYGCNEGECDFFLHEECTKLRTTKTRFIHKHSLTLISIPNFIFQCEACLQHFHGFAYQCKTCYSTFDLRCVSIKNPFKHPNHQHPLYPDHQNRESCDACGKKNTEEKLWFRCTADECKFNLDIGCATLPVTVRYRFDPHPLNLTFVEEERVDDYYCDICEEKREPGLWFYSCKKCSFAAHTRCALGEFPYVKSMVHKLAHSAHPLNLVMKGKEEEGGMSSCGACEESCSHKLAYECGACNFNVHASGKCYESQLLKGNLAFTNRNVFSRANQPYHHPIKWPMIVTLGPFGHGKLRRTWKERVFSTIRGFAVYHNEYKVYYIRIQYAKDGELVWSNNNHDTQAGSEENKVCFDYPDEYLVSIHGCHISGSTIKSLTIQTNRKIYGPFGDNNGDKFSSVKEGVKIIGIFGFEYNLDSIGFEGILTQAQE